MSEEKKPLTLLIDREWFERKIAEDGDEGEVGAGMLAWAMDPQRIADAINNGEDPNAIWDHPALKLYDYGERGRPDLAAHTVGGNEHSVMIERNWEAIIAAGLVHDRNEDRGGLYDDYEVDHDNDIESDREEAIRAERAIDDESDRLFAEDMAEDRERHTFRPGDDFYKKWKDLFDAEPLFPRANFFEEKKPGVWGCQVIDGDKNYVTFNDFPALVDLEDYLIEAGIPTVPDE